MERKTRTLQRVLKSKGDTDWPSKIHKRLVKTYKELETAAEKGIPSSLRTGLTDKLKSCANYITDICESLGLDKDMLFVPDSFTIDSSLKRLISDLRYELCFWKAQFIQDPIFLVDRVTQSIETYYLFALNHDLSTDLVNDLANIKGIWQEKYSGMSCSLTESNTKCQKCQKLTQEIEMSEINWINQGLKYQEEIKNLNRKLSDKKEKIDFIKENLDSEFMSKGLYEECLKKIRKDIENLLDCELPSFDSSSQAQLNNLWIAIRKTLGEVSKKLRLKTKPTKNSDHFQCSASDIAVLRDQLKNITARRPLKVKLADSYITIIPSNTEQLTKATHLNTDEFENIVQHLKQGMEKAFSKLDSEKTSEKYYKTLFEGSKVIEKKLQKKLKSYNNKIYKMKETVKNLVDLMDNQVETPEKTSARRRERQSTEEDYSLESLTLQLKLKEKEFMTSPNYTQVQREMDSLNFRISRLKAENAMQKSENLSSKINKSIYLLEKNMMNLEEKTTRKKYVSLCINSKQTEPIKPQFMSRKIEQYYDSKGEQHRQEVSERLLVHRNPKFGHQSTKSHHSMNNNSLQSSPRRSNDILDHEALGENPRLYSSYDIPSVPTHDEFISKLKSEVLTLSELLNN